MPDTNEGRQISLVDRRKYWRDLFARELVREGFRVCPTGSYSYPPSCPEPDLVVLACTAITPAERTLIQEIAGRNHRLLVLAMTLPVDTMREVFLAGAYDATVMPVRAEEFVDLVRETLAHSEEVVRPQELLIAGM